MIRPAIDPKFCPPIQTLRACRAHADGQPLLVACRRSEHAVARFDLPLPNTRTPEIDALARAVVKFTLWSAGGYKLWLSGPSDLVQAIAADYTPAGARAFDCDFFSKVYGRPFEVAVVSPEEVPPAQEEAVVLGGHLDGCRIGFDLGASDYKLTALKDGEPVWSAEIPWNPRVEASPDYIYNELGKGLRQAAEKLPRVDAIGGSTAGVLVDDKLKVASLIRAVPDADRPVAEKVFIRLREAWGVPLAVANDGDVSALAGALSLNVTGIIGMAMGSSEAVGYLNREGSLTTRITELAFAPVDLNPDAVADEWSGGKGVGANYFSQQAVDKLARMAGLTFPDDMGLPLRLKEVQKRMDEGDAIAAEIFRDIGIYLAYSVPWYAEFYDFSKLMLLGRVMSGKGGDLILKTAQETLKTEFPETAAKIELFLPDEKARRVGQSAAAASLPAIH
ncbi:MAG: ROK family protein [Kiritimatiellia bacterium]|nr:ROK family protein [Kiritimatiellia bacterium]